MLKNYLKGRSVESVVALEALTKLFKKLGLKETAVLERAISNHAMLEAMRKMMAEMEKQIYEINSMYTPMGSMIGDLSGLSGLSAQLGQQRDSISNILEALGPFAQDSSSQASHPSHSSDAQPEAPQKLPSALDQRSPQDQD